MTDQEIRDTFKGQTPALIRMTETEGYKLFMKWLGIQTEMKKQRLVNADNEEDWLIARAAYTSYLNMQDLPHIFLADIQRLDSDSAPVEVPQL